MDTIYLDGNNLTIDKLMEVVEKRSMVDISPNVWDKIETSARLIKQWGDEGRVMYGITTGFGPMVSTIIPPKYQTELQENLVRSHATSVGPRFDSQYVRAAMLCRLHMWSNGISGVRRQTVELLRDMINAGIHPVVPQWGSVGASGDLNPLAHIALSFIGEGEVEYNGEIMPTKDAFAKAGLEAIMLHYKEGLASVNGTAMMTGVAAVTTYKTQRLIEKAEIITALSLEALLASTEPFDAFGNEVKQHPGQHETARRIRKLLEGSELAWGREKLVLIQKQLQEKSKSNGEVDDFHIPVQSAYSIRAIPQVLGAIRDAFTHIALQVEQEINSVDDNPIVNKDIDNVFQGANFHGQPIAMVMDYLAIAITEIGIISERRLNRMLDRVRSEGLSPFLARGKSGLRMGFEGLQYIPTSIIAECRTLCHPASIQSISSNEENQDIVSMGLIAARKAADILEKIEYVLAVELMAAGEALEERDQTKLSPAGKAVYEALRGQMDPYETDVYLHPIVEHIKETLIRSDALISAVAEFVRRA